MSRPGFDEVVLVTGYPSFHARKLVEQILAVEPRAWITAVVLPKLADAAREHVAALPEEHAARVELVEGDAAAIDLGLSGAEFRKVTREVDRIHHVAHVSWTGADAKLAHELNVVGAAEILELARASSSLSCLVHHSTAHVSGDRTGVVYEEELDAGQSFSSEVEATRMRGEVLMRRAMRDVPIAVVRPTSIVGDSRTGEIDRFDGVYLLATLLVTMPADLSVPIPGRGDAPLHLVPIDYVVRAAHAIGKNPAARGRTFHLADPRPLSARSVFDLVASAGGRRAQRTHIPSNLAKAILRTPGIERYLKSPRAFVERIASAAVRYDTRNTDAILAGTGIECPPFESYVDALVAVVQERVRERQKQRSATGKELDADDPLS